MIVTSDAQIHLKVLPDKVVEALLVIEKFLDTQFS